jgi:glycosyltransferase involved in cell wall biosynthesis
LLEERKKMEMISIVIPMYNEEEAIGGDLDTIIRTMSGSDVPWEIIVVDDGSTDASAEIVRQRLRPEAQPEGEGVRLIQHPYNRGTGAARTTGLQHARGDVIVMTDGDGTYPNQDIPRLLAHVGECDMVIGARKMETGSLRWLRSPTKLFIRLLASYLTGVRIPDVNSGFRAFKKSVAERFLDILPTTHSWVGTQTVAFLSEGYAVKFVPIDYYRRKGRKSSFHPIADTYNYISLVVRTIMYFNPLKVFLPVALALIVVGAVKLVRDIVYYRGFYVPGVTLMLILTAIQVGAIGLLADLIVKRAR